MYFFNTFYYIGIIQFILTKTATEYSKSTLIKLINKIINLIIKNLLRNNVIINIVELDERETSDRLRRKSDLGQYVLLCSKL